MLEREFEVAAIRDLLEAPLHGEGVALVVEGAPGIGKTTLLRAAHERAHASGVQVLTAVGGELERAFPFGLVRQLFERRVASASPEERARLFAGAAGLAEPLVATHETGVRHAVGDPVQGTLHGLYWLVANIASRRPILISVDDAHWGDAASLRWLAYLGRRLEGLPVGLAVAMREAVSAPAAQLLAAVAPIAHVLRPRPLSIRATRSLMSELVGPTADEFASVCHSVTGGNPLLLQHLADALVAEGVAPGASEAGVVAELGPVAVSRMLALRLASGPSSAGPLLRAVAAHGTTVALHQAADVARLDIETAADAADALASVGILEPGRPLRVVHPIVRTAILKDIAATELDRLHVCWARRLAAIDADAAEIATHLLATEPRGDAWVIHVLRSAACAAVQEGAPEAAAAYLRRALAEPPSASERAEVLLELGRAEAAARDPAAVRHLSDARSAAQDPRQRANVALELGRVLMLCARPEEAVDVLESELARVEAEDREVAMRLELELAGAARVDLSLRTHFAERLDRLRDYARRPERPETNRLVLANLAFEGAMAGEPASRVADLAGRALAGGRLLPQETAASPAYYLAVNALSLSDRLERAKTALDEAIADARSRGSVLGFGIASCFRSNVNYRLGLLAAAEADALASLEIARQHGWELGLPVSLAFLIEARVETGDVGGADQVFAEAGTARELPNNAFWNLLLYSRAKLRLAHGDARVAYDDLLECGRRQRLWMAPNPAVVHWRSDAALAAGQLGETERARELAREEVELSRAFGARRALGIALRAAGLVERGPRGLELLREAVATLEESPARLEHARALSDLGAALRRTGKRQAAREPLRRALDLAHRCGTRALETRAWEELRAAGARPRRRDVSGIGALTASERRVAAMAAAGMTNREIAEALFVTLKTVEGHLRSAFLKLDIGSRRELPAILADASRD